MNEMNPAGACAACKYPRKRCTVSHFLERYFPLERAEDFENVQTLFGIQKAMEENEREKAIESLILKAKLRRENPVHGPVAVERRLPAEVEKVKKELDMVTKELKFFKGDDDHDKPSSSTV
ncbi:LOB domain-containing protein 27 [Sesamum alatum]|uniref:LOB domain-containing protein 27 n=1 Tax=Sesamum alatum TaxID=300844 RepID=A0AAE2CBB4_9LAMI|nr:LOB domain-containing protein 27 [Sesamum alatum]